MNNYTVIVISNAIDKNTLNILDKNTLSIVNKIEFINVGNRY
tara:strand:+ start:1483 stop:1608 length:126 start_codon:yes stop_codon:yes gene_type:complete